MNICLLGATGRVGTVILENALAAQHSVRALVREKSKLAFNNPLLTVIVGNVLDEADLAAAMTGADAVISALNTGGSTTLTDSMPLIINQMKDQQIKRIITIGTAGILQARSNPSLYRFQSVESKRTTTKDAKDHLKAFLHLKDSGLDWTIICPTYLPIGQRIGKYRYESDFLPENPASISVFDTGDFAFAQLFSPKFIGRRVGLTY